MFCYKEKNWSHIRITKEAFIKIEILRFSLIYSFYLCKTEKHMLLKDKKKTYKNTKYN